MTDQEALIREAIAAEAAQAVDSRVVLAELHRARRRRRPVALIAAAVLTATAAAVAVIVPLAAGRDTASVDPATSSTAAPAPVAHNVLLFGMDQDGNTDSIVLAHVGATGAISLVSLPRDSYVEIPGRGRDKINQAYPLARAEAEAAGRDGAAAGAKALITTVEALTSVRIDHYAAVDMAAFGRLSSLVDGVEVCLREATKDGFSGADFPAGRQALSGDRALAFLRQRHGLDLGDLDRVVRLQSFLHGLGRKLLTRDVLGDPAKLAELVDVMRTHVRTDPGWDLLDFARRLTPGAPIRSGTIPVGQDVEVAGGRGFVIDPTAVRAFIAGFTADTPRTATMPLSPDGEALPGQSEADGCVS